MQLQNSELDWLNLGEPWHHVFKYLRYWELLILQRVSKMFEILVGSSMCWKKFIPRNIRYEIGGLDAKKFFEALKDIDEISKTILTSEKTYGKWYYLWLITRWFANNQCRYWNLHDLILGKIPTELLSDYAYKFSWLHQENPFNQWTDIQDVIMFGYYNKNRLSDVKLYSMIYINIYEYNYHHRTIKIQKESKEHIIAYNTSYDGSALFTFSESINTLTICHIGDGLFEESMISISKDLDINIRSLNYVFRVLFGNIFSLSEVINHPYFNNSELLSQ